VSTYTFFLFPESASKDICLAPSSIDFLRKNNMDFGTWMSKGVTFTDQQGEEWLMKRFGLFQAPVVCDSSVVTTTVKIVDTTTVDSTATVEASAAQVAPAAPQANAWSNQKEIVLTKDSDKEYEQRNMNALNAMMNDETGALGYEYTFEY
jgi:hypothetical protein